MKQPHVERIIQAHTDDAATSPGSIVNCRVDHVYVQDGNTPTVRKYFRDYNFKSVFDGDRISVFFDHGVLACNSAMSDRLKEAQEFCEQFKLRMHPAGTGISHVIAAENGIFFPGGLVLGADSHTCTGGVVQCLALGMGASDVTAAMLTGRVWLRVPETLWISVRGRPSDLAGPKDLMLHILQSFPAVKFLYRSIEWCGPWLESLSLGEAATIANLAVEMGAKCCFLPPRKDSPEGMQSIQPPAGKSSDILEINAEGLPAHVSRPGSPADAISLDRSPGDRVDYVFIGTCTNSRLEDLRSAARILGPNRVSQKVRCVITPGSLGVYRQAIGEGIIEQLVMSGAIVTPPGCGSCVGTQGPIPADNDTVVSTGSRNFVGRMGNPKASVWLASPLVAAAAAVIGRIPTTREMDSCLRK